MHPQAQNDFYDYSDRYYVNYCQPRSCPTGQKLDYRSCRCVIDTSSDQPHCNYISCGPGQVFDDQLCACKCHQVFDCPGSSRFDHRKCSCECPSHEPCPSRYFFSMYSCQCEEVSTTPDNSGPSSCPESSIRNCHNLEILDSTCSCFCPADAVYHCSSHEVFDKVTCSCQQGRQTHCPTSSRTNCDNLEEFDPISCRCTCAARAQNKCPEGHVIDSKCACVHSCPANVRSRCIGNKVLDPETCQCKCRNFPSHCNALQVFDDSKCRCRCSRVIVTSVVTQRARQTTPSRTTATTVTQRARLSTGSRARGRRELHVVEKRRKGKKSNTRSGTRPSPGRPQSDTRPSPGRSQTDTRPSHSGRHTSPGTALASPRGRSRLTPNAAIVRQTIPGPCPRGTFETIHCECV